MFFKIEFIHPQVKYAVVNVSHEGEAKAIGKQLGPEVSNITRLSVYEAIGFGSIGHMSNKSTEVDSLSTLTDRLTAVDTSNA